MFIGHFAAGFAAKRWAPKQSLGLLIAAPIFLDILWPLLCLAGVERFHIEEGNTVFQPLVFDHYPWSHSLLMSLVWGTLFALAVRRLTGDGKGALVAGALVVSHWFLDVVTHAPDMPLWPGGGPRFGLVLWNSTVGTLAVETLLFLVGVTMYVRTTRARNLKGAIGWWVYVVLLAAAFYSGYEGKAPPSLNAVLVPAVIATLLMPLWAWWVDRNREVLP